MKIIRCEEPGILVASEKEKPEPKAGEAILKIRRIGICGTDLHAFEGTQPYFNYPRILGHELSAELIDNGGAKDFQVGERVTFLPYLNCGTCIACRIGKPNCCTHMEVFGVHRDGGMAEYLQIPARLLVHGENLGYDELALVEPLAIGAHSIRRAQVVKGEFVLVMGAGPIGLGIMEFARIAGAEVIALDVNEKRLAFCQDKLGVKHVINPLQHAVPQKLLDMTNGDMPTVVIDASGNQTAINSGFAYLAHGGRYILVGLQKDEIMVSHPEFHKRESTLMSSRNATLEDFNQVIACMKSGEVKPENYITHRVGFQDLQQEFVHWLNPESGVIKAMVEL